MVKNKNDKKKKITTDPEREMAFNSLPPNVRTSLTEEEIELFLHAEVWPEELFEKLKEFMTTL